MALYDQVASSLSSKGLIGSISSGLSSSLGGVASSAAKAMGGSPLASTVANIGNSMASNAAMGLVNKYIPAKVQGALNAGAGIAGDLMNGNFEGAGMKLLGSGLLNKLLPGMSGVASQTAYWGTPTPLFGGISPMEARGIAVEMGENRFSKKNLFIIEVSSKLQGAGVMHRFNMFVTELSYAPLTLTGDKIKIGSASVDSVKSSEPVEMRITTLDDHQGTLKRWYSDHHAAAAPEDGTVGHPGDYAIKIKVVHAFITQGSNQGGYEDIGLYRPANIEFTFSRREDGLQELQMTFSQLDTFMKA
ncbi:hypothetical protein [Propionivibrio sp.]|uniref:hypothetical protein n=1 Tax=Propionivibrio sp. TaxID=2212460 RepID=UPI003BF3E01A